MEKEISSLHVYYPCHCEEKFRYYLQFCVQSDVVIPDKLSNLKLVRDCDTGGYYQI